ncbi:MAG: cytochrome c biogenesis protein CcdA [Rikenellaceae bacterium]
MKRFLMLCLGLFVALSATAQIEWGAPQLTRQDGDKYMLSLSAKLDEGWHLYDLVEREGGANATSFTFGLGEGVELVGEVRSVESPILKYDPIFAMEIGYYEGGVTFEQMLTIKNPETIVNVAVEWMLCNDSTCIPPDSNQFEVSVGGASREITTAHGEEWLVQSQPSNTSSNNLWWTIIEAMLWGFAALLTPCVFPMIPMTISYFLKGSDSPAKGRLSAMLYGLFVVALYTLPIAAIVLITRVLGGDAVTADIFNWLATHWLPNVLFFVVFMIFAASFFGAFEINMPSSWVNRSDSKADRGSVVGIFFLALTLVLVSFSCTGPIIGSVLIGSTQGEFWMPIITILAFSAAFALPFVLFALFPNMVKNLPKSGGWLGSVKVVLGFVEIALGLKFLSVADQTYHWGILDREVYLAVWIVVFALLGFYLLGKLRFKHDAEVKYIGVGRLALAIVTFSFVVYMIPGMWGAPLRALSGYLPPLETQDFVMGAGGEVVPSKAKKYSDIMGKSFPNGLDGFYDYAEARDYADEVGKPLLVDLTGHGCVNCRAMEQRVWSEPEVNRILRDDYVVVALYMDDKYELPKSEWVRTESGRVLKNLGRINSHFALQRYGVNAQPYYIIEGCDGQQLVPARGYDLDVEAYVRFLEDGLSAYKGQ